MPSAVPYYVFFLEVYMSRIPENKSSYENITYSKTMDVFVLIELADCIF